MTDVDKIENFAKDHSKILIWAIIIIGGILVYAKYKSTTTTAAPTQNLGGYSGGVSQTDSSGGVSTAAADDANNNAISLASAQTADQLQIINAQTAATNSVNTTTAALTTAQQNSQLSDYESELQSLFGGITPPAAVAAASTALIGSNTTVTSPPIPQSQLIPKNNPIVTTSVTTQPTFGKDFSGPTRTVTTVSSTGQTGNNSNVSTNGVVISGGNISSTINNPLPASQTSGTVLSNDNLLDLLSGSEFGNITSPAQGIFLLNGGAATAQTVAGDTLLQGQTNSAAYNQASLAGQEAFNTSALQFSQNEDSVATAANLGKTQSNNGLIGTVVNAAGGIIKGIASIFS